MTTKLFITVDSINLVSVVPRKGIMDAVLKGLTALFGVKLA